MSSVFVTLYIYQRSPKIFHFLQPTKHCNHLTSENSTAFNSTDPDNMVVKAEGDTPRATDYKTASSTFESTGSMKPFVGSFDMFMPNRTVLKPSPKACPPKLHFGKGLPLTALFSAPGCGNTWVRHLIQQSTGKEQSRIYVWGGRYIIFFGLCPGVDKKCLISIQV